MSEIKAKKSKIVIDLCEVIDFYCPSGSTEELVKAALEAQANALQATMIRLKSLGVADEEIEFIIESGKNEVVLQDAEDEGLFSLPLEEDV